MRTHLNLLLVVSAIFALGIVMIFSATSADLLDHSQDHHIYMPLFKQLGYAAVGLILMGIVARIEIKRWLRCSPMLMLGIIVLLFIVLIPGIGREVNGAKRWLSIVGLSFQPSEFLKLVLPLYLVHRFSTFNYTISTSKDFIKFLLPTLVALLLVFAEPNNGTVILLFSQLIFLLFLLGVSKRFWAIPLAILIVLLGCAVMVLPYPAARLAVFLQPEKDLLGRGHQPYQAKIAAGSGGLWGKGPGNSWQKLSYLPEAQNDYIAAIYAEEFGFAGMLILLFLYTSMIVLIAIIAMQTIDKQAFYLRSCLLCLFGVQTFLNLAVVSGLSPSTGLNLPFFSQGGTSLIAYLVGLGLLLSPSRDKELFSNLH